MPDLDMKGMESLKSTIYSFKNMNVKGLVYFGKKVNTFGNNENKGRKLKSSFISTKRMNQDKYDDISILTHINLNSRFFLKFEIYSKANNSPESVLFTVSTFYTLARVCEEFLYMLENDDIFWIEKGKLVMNDERRKVYGLRNSFIEFSPLIYTLDNKSDNSGIEIVVNSYDNSVVLTEIQFMEFCFFISKINLVDLWQSLSVQGILLFRDAIPDREIESLFVPK